jgi:hypothetical protein
MAVVADLNADVRGDALNYRDPAIAVPQDKATGRLDRWLLACCTPVAGPSYRGPTCGNCCAAGHSSGLAIHRQYL